MSSPLFATNSYRTPTSLEFVVEPDRRLARVVLNQF